MKRRIPTSLFLLLGLLHYAYSQKPLSAATNQTTLLPQNVGPSTRVSSPNRGNSRSNANSTFAGGPGGLAGGFGGLSLAGNNGKGAPGNKLSNEELLLSNRNKNRPAKGSGRVKPHNREDELPISLPPVELNPPYNASYPPLHKFPAPGSFNGDSRPASSAFDSYPSDIGSRGKFKELLKLSQSQRPQSFSEGKPQKNPSQYPVNSKKGKLEQLKEMMPKNRPQNVPQYPQTQEVVNILPVMANPDRRLSNNMTQEPAEDETPNEEDDTVEEESALGSGDADMGSGNETGAGEVSKYERQNPPDQTIQWGPRGEKKGPLEKLKSRNHAVNVFPHRTYTEPTEMDETLGLKCGFETECAWHWEEDQPDDFHVLSGGNLTSLNRTGTMPGPTADVYNNANGRFLYARLTPKSGTKNLTSPTFGSTRENCILQVVLHQSGMGKSAIRIVIEPLVSPSWVPAEIMGNDLRKWGWHTFRIGRISQEFRVSLEVARNNNDPKPRSHISIDNLEMRNCFAENISKGNCSATQVQCMATRIPVCINPERICDHSKECDGGEDENKDCDKIPFGGSCDFEHGNCGWKNSANALMDWTRHSGSTPTDKTGPDHDHTHMSTAGHYMFVNMNQHAADAEKKARVGFASNAVMNSVIFNPPPTVHSNQSSPYRNSCMVRFYVHQFGLNAGSINLSVVEIRDKENITSTLWWSSKNLGTDWIRVTVQIPSVVNKYYLQFEARMGMRIYSDVAVDDFSLSPECFGLNIPVEHLNGYNYWDPRIGISKQAHKAFETRPFFIMTTCNTRGVNGPNSTACADAYNQSLTVDTAHHHETQQQQPPTAESGGGGAGAEVKVEDATKVTSPNSIRVLDKAPFKGVQVWRVPSEGYYTIIVKGAGGGLGSGGVGSSRGAMVTSVMELHRDEKIHVLVGQSGEHACIKSMGLRDQDCDTGSPAATGISPPITQVRNINIEDGAGGGGGGTFVFLLNSANTAVPLLVAGGGGGLGIGRYFDDDLQHGQMVNVSLPDVSGVVNGIILDDKVPGPGGGWRPREMSAYNHSAGMALLEGARGGFPCYKRRGVYGQGGFGGGGGGCRTGGGGGGYSGGNSSTNTTNGNGGMSYIGMSRTVPEFSHVYAGANSGSGSVIIIPAIEGCGCDYRCVALDEFRSLVACICPEGWRLSGENQTLCEPITVKKRDIPLQFWIIFFGVVTVALVAALAGLIFMLYNRYQRKKQANLRRKMLLEQDLQLSRLRHTGGDDSALTNFNPNYGCDGILNGNVDVKSLPQVARESLRLVKALGQGAFGEVYQGLYRHRDGDAVEMPVAVKTLPEMSTGQAEADFLMEAAIMAKFNHPNIVHLIGVCFDRHPRFIVLELLAGGDLKNFLREGRNKPERPSPLTMKDLVFCALDVAKGCRYMESKRFIHRDIAARNCLLSSKGPGRVVKIADFGMARDIYRSDYYRKGGKAMLPIKWMPPEAFLDGIFTSKTDVWSFGVLLWEVFSLGLMPYTGLPNREVMQLVTGGGRLDAPPGCPPAIYRIMADCWNPTPEERPTFSNLLDRLTTCTQDPDVMNAPLPNFFRPPSNERDTTIMRPGNDDFCLQVPNSDYLIPLSGPRLVAEKLMCEATGVTLSETMPTYTSPRITSPAIPNGDSGCWETSFSHSSSEQPLINGAHGPSLERLISLDTPQQTPTATLPPISFGPPLAHPISTDGGKALDIIPPPITLDPSTLQNCQGTGYANVRMTSQSNLSDGTMAAEKAQQDGGGGGGESRSPFTIQNYSDPHYKENHSEISC